VISKMEELCADHVWKIDGILQTLFLLFCMPFEERMYLRDVR
jgi:hypothetical protein